MIDDRCPWYVAGPLLGVVLVAVRALTNKPFGALGGYVDLADSVRAPKPPSFRLSLLAGLVLGGAIYAALKGSFMQSAAHASTSFASSRAVEVMFLVLAGSLIGFGARTAGGCTSGHGLCGVSLGSRASFVATMTFFATAVGVAHLLASIGGVS